LTVTDLEAGITTFEFDIRGRKRSVTDPNGNRTEYTYDSLDHPGKIVHPEITGYSLPAGSTNVQEFVHDPMGNLLSETDRNGLALVYTYTERNQVKTVERSTGGRMTLVYDANGNRTSVSTPAGSTTYTFDARNRMETAAADGLTTTTAYTADGKKAAVIYPNGTSAHYQYHPSNRVKSISNQSGDAIISHYSYQYDPNGNRTVQTEVQNGATETTTYGYDRLDRLRDFTVTSGESPTRRTEYTYEGYNRRTERLTENGTLIKSETYTYDETDWLRRIEDNAKTITFEYDANGNTTKKSDDSLPNQDTVFVYDSRNQLIEAKRGPPTRETVLGSYDYNAEGMRVRHRESDRGDVDTFYDGRSVIEERNPRNNSLLAHYRYADRLISLDTRTARQYYHYDALGSTANLTDDSGSTSVSYRLDPWGRIRSQLGSSINRRIFTGKEHDTQTGLIYFGARYYDPDTARFLTQDPYLGESTTPPSLHRYLYAYSNPTVYVDPDGHIALLSEGAEQLAVFNDWLKERTTHYEGTGAVGVAGAVATGVARGLVGMSEGALILQRDIRDTWRVTQRVQY
jgi:RHS repeat-associated protein